MGLDGIYNVPEFRYDPRVEKSDKKNKDKRKKKEEDENKKKKKNGGRQEALFESLADSLTQYGDEPFQFSG